MNKNQLSDSYQEISISLPKVLADPLGSYINDNITSGLVYEESANSDMLVVKFYIEDSKISNILDGLELYLNDLAAINKIATPEIQKVIVKSVDWEEEYRRSVRPVEINSDLLIRPPWAESESGYKHEIIIEPKMAFGTGSHETTSNCLNLMKKYFGAGQSFLDFGCGSGILAIYADHLNASSIKAIDNDSVATENCQENFLLNSVTVKHDIVCGSIEDIEPSEKFDMICANVAKKQILQFLNSLFEHTKENGYLVLSGMLVSDLDEIEAALKQAGLEAIDFIQDKEWLTYCIRK